MTGWTVNSGGGGGGWGGGVGGGLGGGGGGGSGAGRERGGRTWRGGGVLTRVGVAAEAAVAAGEQAGAD